MPLARHTLLFFDASCLIAAAGSPTGGSSFLLAVCARGFLRAAVSQLVLVEAEGNILRNLSPAAWQRYQEQILTLPLVVAPVPGTEELDRLAPLVTPKDAHVFAAALALQAPFLISLDRPLLQQINQARLPLEARTPGEFITGELPQHPDYRSLR